MHPRPITLISILCILGCSSPKASIDNAAISVGSQAIASKILAEDISTTTLEPDTASKADKIVAHQDNIIETSSDIRTQLHGVEDSTPWWGRLLQQGFVSAAIICVIILLWQTGIGSLVKKIVWSIGWFIPRSAMRSAEMDLKVERKKISSSEAVAARRSDSAAYEAARKYIKNKDKKA